MQTAGDGLQIDVVRLDPHAMLVIRIEGDPVEMRPAS
jgi:hypothetical protein